MAAVATAVTDLDRLRGVGRYDLANGELRARLDAITEVTRRHLGLPVSLVSLVLDSAQFFVGSSGLDGWMKAAGGTPVEWSFCARAVASGRPYVVEDAVLDKVQADNPLVTIDGIGSYAGVPLVSPEGHVIGAHCVIGPAARAYTADDVAYLEQAGAEVMAVLEQHVATRAA